MIQCDVCDIIQDYYAGILIGIMSELDGLEMSLGVERTASMGYALRHAHAIPHWHCDVCRVRCHTAWDRHAESMRLLAAAQRTLDIVRAF